MNKTEKIICLLLGAVLAWYVFVETPKADRARAEAKAQMATNVVAEVEASVAAKAAEVAEVEALVTAKAAEVAEPNCATQAVESVESEIARRPEETAVLSNAQMAVTLTTWGGAVRAATIFGYAVGRGPVSDDNPPVTLDFAEAPALALVEGANIVRGMDYRIAEQGADYVVFERSGIRRTLKLGADYRIFLKDEFSEAMSCSGAGLSLGAMKMGGSKNDLLSIDSMAIGPKGEEAKHWCEEDPLKGFLVGGLSGGCSGSRSAEGLPESQTVQVGGAQRYLAVKNRFFVSALASSSVRIDGFGAVVRRDMRVGDYRPRSVEAIAKLPQGAGAVNEVVFYLGPKKQALLWDLGMKDVMEFGMWRWICYPIVWCLNLFNDWIPNYGVAIILLTILVRIIFWPLTHKSTVGMKKMQEVQPLMKEIQAKYKDNPQRLQQETMALYREKKVNPLSSCLPMLIQIPVFIALFNVLRSAVELRYAPFLWIGDLSEPEALFASWFPFGGLNILPILMALSTALQSYFTPTAGDAKQQRMMMIMMPAMMLVMFYSFPSALSLYWFLSNLFSIVQMWLIRRQTAVKQTKEGVITPEVIDPPQTRQMRRHG